MTDNRTASSNSALRRKPLPSQDVTVLSVREHAMRGASIKLIIYRISLPAVITGLRVSRELHLYQLQSVT